MTAPAPQNANDFIERQLDQRLLALEDAFDSDALSFIGALVFGVDDIIRDVVETIRRESRRPAKLTVILTTPGGYVEVVHRIVDTLRHHYAQVGFVVPNQAFSAGTVLVMSGDSIYMDYYSRLGPIDPQVETANGRRVPALGYLIQWERLLQKARSGQLTLAETQLMIQGFDQAELYQYEHARELSVTLLRDWLVKYKFKDWVMTETRNKRVTDGMRKNRAEHIARELNNTDRWHSHGYGISMDVLRRDLKLRIDDFGELPGLTDIIKPYYSLLEDYRAKRGNEGVLHTKGTYLPFM